MSLPDILVYLGSFVVISLAAKLVVSSADRFCKDLRISPFFVSFVVLGLLTSITEFAVGVTSVVRGDPQIFMGNLLGGVIVIFLFIIPLLAVIGNGIKLSHNLQSSHLIYALFTVAAPAIFVFDGRITIPEGLLLMLAYFVLVWILRGRRIGAKVKPLGPRSHPLLDLVKLALGVVVVIVASQIIIDKTLLLSSLLRVSPYVVSVIVLSIGTNLPELSLAISSIVSKKKDIAFGDYMGSAAANTLFFGFFALLSGGSVVANSDFSFTFVAIMIAVCLFYFFAKSHNFLSRTEGLILLGVYSIFIIVELIISTYLGYSLPSMTTAHFVVN